MNLENAVYSGNVCTEYMSTNTLNKLPEIMAKIGIGAAVFITSSTTYLPTSTLGSSTRTSIDAVSNTKREAYNLGIKVYTDKEGTELLTPNHENPSHATPQDGRGHVIFAKGNVMLQGYGKHIIDPQEFEQAESLSSDEIQIQHKIHSSKTVKANVTLFGYQPHVVDWDEFEEEV